jgi:hypothetical protein
MEEILKMMFKIINLIMIYQINKVSFKHIKILKNI